MATETRSYHLGRNYGLTPMHGDKMLRDVIPSQAERQAKLPWAFKAAQGALLKLPPERFGDLTYFAAVLLDAVFRQEADGNLSNGFLNTFNFVEIPEGRYTINANVPFPRGGIIGMGSFPYYGSGGDQGYATTEITMAKQYIGAPAEQYALATPNFNLVHTDNFSAYNESFRVSDIALTNYHGTTPGVTRIGLLLTASGELSAASNIRANDFDIGVCLEAPTPFSGGDFSLFNNRVAGFATRGAALSTASAQTLSGDRNGSLFRQLPGRKGEAAGGTFVFTVGKAEDANQQGEGKFASQVTAWCSGQFAVTVHQCRPTSEDRINDAAFVVYPYIGAGQKQNSLLKVTGQGHRHNTLLHDLGTGQRIAWPGDFKAFDFTYASEDNSFSTPLPGDWKWEQAGTAVLGSVERDPMTGQPKGTWNYAAGTPGRKDDRDHGYYGGDALPCRVKQPVDMAAMMEEVRRMVAEAVAGGVPSPPDAGLRAAAAQARDILDAAL